jgi:predicted nucleic acid-binding protein
MKAKLKVVDTSAWIEWLADTDIGRKLQPDFPNLTHCILPSIVLYEIAMWSLRKRTPKEHEDIMSLLDLCQFKALDRDTVDTAIALELDRRLPMADRLIYATAHAQGVDVLTCDAHFEGLPHVIFHRNVKAPPSVSEVGAVYARSHVPMARGMAH